MRPSLRAVLILVPLLCWPPLHMGLAKLQGFSPWRYGGWGMYAMPDPQRDTQVLIVLPKGGEQRSDFTSPLGFARFEQGVLVPVDVDLPIGRQLTVLAVRDILVFRDRSSMRFLVEVAHEGPDDPDGALLLMLRPRVDLLRAVAFAEIDAYVYAAGSVSELDRFRTDRLDPEEILAALRAAQRARRVPSES